MPKQALTPLDKARKYCAYQERCPFEVRQKLYQWQVEKSEHDKIINQLIDEKFIDEQRFASIYARGKFRIKKWGRIKIRAALIEKRIPAPLIDEALKEINEDQYLQTLQEQLEKKSAKVKDKDDYIKNQKVAAYLMQKGYEAGLVWERLKE